MTSVFGYRGLIDTIGACLKKGRRVQLAGASDVLAELIVTSLSCARSEITSPLVVVVPSAKDMSPWLNFVGNLSAVMNSNGANLRTAVLPFFSSYGNDRFINHAISRRQRVYALAQLRDPCGPLIVVTTLQALAQLTLPVIEVTQSCLSLATGLELDQDVLISQLEDLGYLPSAAVNEQGNYAVRGGIVDVYPANQELPLRLEFVGDLLSSIRVFDPSDQKSKGTTDSSVIFPAYEVLTPTSARKEQTQVLFNHLLEHEVPAVDRDGVVSQFQLGVKFHGFDMFTPIFRQSSMSTMAAIVPSANFFFPTSIESCTDAFNSFFENICEHFDSDKGKRLGALPPESHFTPPGELATELTGLSRVIECGNPYASDTAEFLRLEARFVLPGAPINKSQGAELFDKWLELISRILADQNGTVVLIAQHEEQRERMLNLLTHRGFKPQIEPDILLQLATASKFGPGIYIGSGSLSSHLWLEDQTCLVLPEQVLFGIPPRRPKPASQKLQNYLNSFADLKVGDLVVHVQHGIGRYTGLTTLSVAGLNNDFLLIEYAGGDKVYLPVDRLSLLQRYSSGGEIGGHHSLDKLGGLGWERRKAKAKGAIQDMADKLLRLHAQRSLASIRPFSPADDEYLKFEAEFTYDETEDQLRAIHDVEADLVVGKPMDRLVCGDVGFGKTEVALRAAMRTVLEGAQVLVLVPTTVLCYQHYRLFKSRLESHGVRVAQVNRFVSSAAIKEATAGLASGSIDVLIGTHRLLSKDVKPKKLGLLVVDEEQRFGVGHKEKLKELRAGAHVLTLTATPIPRTLHMAMVGMRDISIIATPPHDRMAVKTYIARFDETLIKEAIEQEIRRGGQVFFVHNRVEDIEEVRLFLKTIVPGVDIRIGHGQMAEHQLERVILDFIEQRFQVLLCTTIIESGIDMPNVNTLIVNHAERFGLAQLYQLRGRVGRSNQQAYAYFLTPPAESLSDDSRKRLDVLAAHQELGAGFQIASYDLELRGAGNLLGGEQSGHAAAVGLELYTEMLEDAIQTLRGEPVADRIDTEIKLPVAALIPVSYIQSEPQRLQMYKKLFACETEAELRGLKQEIQDRYGALPAPTTLLFKVARLKQQLKSLGALRVTAGKGVCEIKFAPLGDKMIDTILGTISRQPGRYKLAPDHRLLLYLNIPVNPSVEDQENLIGELSRLVAPLVASVPS